MRILYITGDMGVEVGGRKGASTHVREACHALARFGHEVRIITPAPGDTSHVKVPVIHVPPPRAKWMGSDLRYMVLNRRMRRAIATQIRDFRPHAIYERYSLYQTAGLELCRKHRLPRILEVNTLLARELANRLHWPGFAEKIERSLWKREPAVVTVSQTLKRLMIDSARMEPEKMAGFAITPNAVDPAVFHPETAPAVEVQRLAGARQVAGYTGTLTAWHGVDLFFEAAQILRDRGANCLLLAVGGDPQRVERLRAQAKERGVESHLHFYGSIPHGQVPSFLAAMNVYLIPDTQDWSSPTKFFEFAAMGRPIVASRSPSVDEVFGGENAGFFFERGNATGMVDSILEALKSADEAKARAQVARQRVLQRHTWNSNVHTMMELYRAQGVPEEIATFPLPYTEAPPA